MFFSSFCARGRHSSKRIFSGNSAASAANLWLPDRLPFFAQLTTHDLSSRSLFCGKPLAAGDWQTFGKEHTGAAEERKQRERWWDERLSGRPFRRSERPGPVSGTAFQISVVCSTPVRSS